MYHNNVGEKRCIVKKRPNNFALQKKKIDFFLFLQGAMFYFPHLLFKAWEGGKVRNIIAGLNNLILVKEEREKKERILATYMAESLNTHNFWAMKMLLIEFLNLLNAVFQIYFIDVFLQGEFR